MFDSAAAIGISSRRLAAARVSKSWPNSQKNRRNRTMDPTISIINRSKTVADSDVKFVLPALQKQITRDFELVCGWGAHLKFNTKRFDMQVIIKDTAGKGGYLGYHIKDGKPITYIFAKDDIEDSGE